MDDLDITERRHLSVEDSGVFLESCANALLNAEKISIPVALVLEPILREAAELAKEGDKDAAGSILLKGIGLLSTFDGKRRKTTTPLIMPLVDSNKPEDIAEALNINESTLDEKNTRVRIKEYHQHWKNTCDELEHQLTRERNPLNQLIEIIDCYGGRSAPSAAVLSSLKKHTKDDEKARDTLESAVQKNQIINENGRLSLLCGPPVPVQGDDTPRQPKPSRSPHD